MRCVCRRHGRITPPSRHRIGTNESRAATGTKTTHTNTAVRVHKRTCKMYRNASAKTKVINLLGLCAP